MVPRTLALQLADYAGWFPVVSVTGPRQSGKSTLVRSVFSDYEYVNLENEGVYNLAREAPFDFIRERPPKLVIDEAQRIPELFSAIQVVSDETGRPGQYVLSGSQNFLLMKGITQSLAGRVGILRLLPFSYQEALAASTRLSSDDFMLTGGYPRIYDASIPPRVFYDSYMATYVERDAAGLIGPRSLVPFRTFLGLCAQAAGNLLNTSRLAADVGVARATVDSWLSVLEASYLLFRLPPYSGNLRKRLTKTPKLYFHDTGLLCHLLGIETWEQLRDSEHRGAVFENLVIAERFKRHANAGREPRLFFYRDDSKIEVDLVDLTEPSAPVLVEAKSTMTYQRAHARHLETVGDLLGVPAERRYLVMRAAEGGPVGGARITPIGEWLSFA